MTDQNIEKIVENSQEEVVEKAKETTAKKRCCRLPQCTARMRWTALVIVVALIGVYSYAQSKHITSVKGLFGMGLNPVETVDPTDAKQWSYAAGYVLGKQLEQTVASIPDGESIDHDIMFDAIRDVMAGEETTLTMEQVQEILQARAEAEEAKAAEIAQQNLELGEAFIAEYRQQDGVQETANGTLYKVLEQGIGYRVGKQAAQVHYVGKLVDGTEFDNSRNFGDEPIAFSSEDVVPGFGEALELMRVGDKWEIVIPADQAYGTYGAPGGLIGPNETLIFELEVVGIEE
jgi:FKBP-type peptidyl-prolyl cis-trans isomerase FklB